MMQHSIQDGCRNVSSVQIGFWNKVGVQCTDTFKQWSVKLQIFTEHNDFSTTATASHLKLKHRSPLDDLSRAINYNNS